MTSQQLDNTVLQLDPSVVHASENIRHGLLASKVSRLAENIVQTGGVQEPISVIDNGDGTYDLLKGFYRHAAVTQLNAEQGANLALPAIVRQASDPKTRLILQVSENVARAELSPMDVAQSIRKLLDAGVSRSEVRAMFPRPGGRKGNTVTFSPASNAWVNIMLGLLELPKGIQTKIHEGIVSTSAAYELGKLPAEKREAVLARAEQELADQIAEEEKDETKFLKSEQREAVKAEREAKAKAAEEAETKELAENRQIVKDSAVKIKDALKALAAAKKVAYDPNDAEAKKAWGESVKAAETDLKAAQKVKTDADNKVAKLLKAQNERKEKAATKAQEPAPAAAKAVGPADIRAAAKGVEGASNGAVALKASDIRQGLKDISKDKDAPLRVQAIAKAVLAFCDGELTPKLLTGELETILKGKPAPAAAANPA